MQIAIALQITLYIQEKILTYYYCSCTTLIHLDIYEDFFLYKSIKLLL